MRKLIVAGAMIAGFFAAGALSGAQAMTLSTPAAVAKAVGGNSTIDQVRYVCRRYWTGFGWSRSCYYRPSYYGYGYSRPSYGYYRWHHRHRYHRYGYRY